jgi:hypothetical protein
MPRQATPQKPVLSRVISPSLLRFDEPSPINDGANLVRGEFAGYRVKAAKMDGEIPRGGRVKVSQCVSESVGQWVSGSVGQWVSGSVGQV